ncbi:MAG: hypothetical protein AB8B56_21380 [Crocinitomicaceae bacterium]
MKVLLQILLALIINLVNFTTFSQEGLIRVNIEGAMYDGDDCFQISVTQGTDTIHVQTMTDDYFLEGDGFLIDSLIPGEYFVNVRNCGEQTDELFVSKTSLVEVREDEIARVNFYMYQNVSYSSVNVETREEIVEVRGEFQAEYSYFDFRWNPDGNDPKWNLGIASSGYLWMTFSKHVGFLIGGGLGWNFAQLQIDQQTSAVYPDEVKSNYYNYFYANYDMKVRFSTLNQQTNELKGHNVFLDIGATYHLPLYFKRVTRFNIQDKLVNSFIHRYSDVRLYANFGVTNFQVFASYRPFDFINKNLPQFPKYNFGVKFNIHD